MIYAALPPALVRAKCGNVDYSWGADALASAHDYAVTMMLYVVYLCYAIAGMRHARDGGDHSFQGRHQGSV